MKKHVLFASIIVVFLASCQKQNDDLIVNIDTDAVKSQLYLTSDPSKEEVQSFLLSGNLKSTENNTGSMVVKSATIGNSTLVEIFKLTEDTYVVDGKTATKQLIYYEINSSGHRLKLLTISQQFTMKEGKIDTSIPYVLGYSVGSIFNKSFYLNNSDNVDQINYFFRFNDGRQFAYFGDNNSSRVNLPPIAGGKWQLEVSYYDGEISQKFMTEMIDYQSDVINLNLDIKTQNVVSLIDIDKSQINGAYLIQLSGKDKQGNYQYLNYPVAYDENLSQRISYDAPFDIETVYICGMYGCSVLYTDNATFVLHPQNGTIVYGF